MSAEIIMDGVLDACIDSLKILPFLFVTYLVMEALEGRTGQRWSAVIAGEKRLGPLFGAVLGVVPQCGFSAAASNLYAGRLITAGTLLAVFLSTSDEMLPLLLSAGIPVSMMIRILCIKALLAMLFGFILDLAVRSRRGVRRILPRSQVGSGELLGVSDETGRADSASAGFEASERPARVSSSPDAPRIGELCAREHCHCELTAEEASRLVDARDSKNKKMRVLLILRSALTHTLHIFVFVLLFTVAANLLITVIGEERMSTVLYNSHILSHFIAGLIGLIPNCAASVVITELWLHGMITAGTMFSGLLVGAGVGLLILFRVNPERKKSLAITAVLYLSGVLGGFLVDLISRFGIL